MSTKIIELEMHGAKGWKFNLLGTTYRTNRMGEGLWQRVQAGVWSDGEPAMEWRQVRGVLQFSLPSDRRAAYAKIRREFSDTIEEYKLFG